MSWRPALNSIATRLVLLGLAMVVASLTVRYFTLSDFLRQDLTGVVSQQQLSLARYAAADIDGKIRERLDQLERLAATLPWQDGVPAPDAAVTARLTEPPEAAAGVVLGRRYTGPSGRSPVTVPADRAAWPLPDNALRLPSADTGQTAVLPLTVPVTGPDGSPQGTLTEWVSLSAPGFLGVLLNSQIGQSSGGFLVVSPRDQLFVAASQADMVLRPTPPAGVNPLHDRAMAGQRGTGVTTNARGIEEISAMASVPSTG